jgi:ATP-binding cassette subfamily B protein/subfamily B ATP-binding cassette protein MsbA
MGIELDKNISMSMIENIQALRLLHTMGQLEQADQDIRSRMGELEGNKRAQAKLNSINAPIMAVLPILMIAALTSLSLIVFGNRSSGILPSLVTFVMALQRLNGSITSITQSLGSLTNNAAGLDILNRILESSDKEFRRKSGASFNALTKGIEFRDVTLSYSPDLKPALSNIDLKITKGQTIALVGTSGSGKSTLADMLIGLYPASSGELLIDGIPLVQLDLSSWQKRLGVVSQDTFLFNASIFDNIRFGNPGATMADVEAASRKAQAHTFITELPMGYETVIGERGYRLSGGQRQRLSLSRAILRDPELLILDEATSALDTESEELVQQAIDQFEGKYTVLVIAHRLSTIVNADVICVMEQGKIIERGTHAELIKMGGRYSKLWAKQSKEKSGQVLAS